MWGQFSVWGVCDSNVGGGHPDLGGGSCGFVRGEPCFERGTPILGVGYLGGQGGNATLFLWGGGRTQKEFGGGGRA